RAHLTRPFRLSPHSPASPCPVVLALPLGLGTNPAFFSVVISVLLKPAPFPAPARLVLFTNPPGTGTAASPAKFQHWREQTSVVQDVSAFRTGVVNLTGATISEQIPSAQVS